MACLDCMIVLEAPQENYSVRQISAYGLRWVLSFLLVEAMAHFFYYNAFAISGVWWQLSPFEIFLIGYGLETTTEETGTGETTFPAGTGSGVTGTGSGDDGAEETCTGSGDDDAEETGTGSGVTSTGSGDDGAEETGTDGTYIYARGSPAPAQEMMVRRRPALMEFGGRGREKDLTIMPVFSAPSSPEPVPVTPEPVPVSSAPSSPEPMPMTPEPVPVSAAPSSPEPMPVSSAPSSPEPVPVTAVPVPVSSALSSPEPVPVTPEPVPVTPEPVPVTPEPVPVSSAPSSGNVVSPVPVSSVVVSSSGKEKKKMKNKKN
ncbi:hypothetical protein ACMD2_20806 [Ananas comosus]|uniref:Uncharacterized protein n=1 Tax=Ananas comosus TaxID=4615 RepID=A0A199V072_ANACO|nr:hypothetical protein ACMD2_20806 [Ananas comosus]